MKTFIRSRGAVPVRETAPATAPEASCFHQTLVLFSSSVNSSGMARLSPIGLPHWGFYLCGTLAENAHCLEARAQFRDVHLPIVVGIKLLKQVLVRPLAVGIPAPGV
ncbi:hypothetical protein EYF80_021980 [Liparis tanakae]|uniref:Uncharacterized protein n=1 Tax=Liparis tanakae TaxID=230148 RepID=A0A4Z2HPQ3_9TELE|nr:hypothetical protein EYF80_021980 [Liparis tanakae]